MRKHSWWISMPFRPARGLSQISWGRSPQSSFNWNKAPGKRALTVTASPKRYTRPVASCFLPRSAVTWWCVKLSALLWSWSEGHVCWADSADTSLHFHRQFSGCSCPNAFGAAVSEICSSTLCCSGSAQTSSSRACYTSVFDLFTRTNFVFYELVCLHRFCYSHTVLRLSWRGRRTMRIILLMLFMDLCWLYFNYTLSWNVTIWRLRI